MAQVEKISNGLKAISTVHFLQQTGSFLQHFIPWPIHRRILLALIPAVETISKCSIGLKIKAGRGDQPQTYIAYFEDWPPRLNADIAFERTF
jgi:hypothetical protein